MYSCTFASLTCRWPQLFFTASDDHQNQNVSHLVVSPRLGSLLSILFRLNTSRHCGDIFYGDEFGCRLCWCMIFGINAWATLHWHPVRLFKVSLLQLSVVHRSHLLISCRSPGWRMCHPLPLEAGTVRSWKRAMSVNLEPGSKVRLQIAGMQVEIQEETTWNQRTFWQVSASIVSWIQ